MCMFVIISLCFRGVSKNVQMVCTIIDQIIQFIKHNLLQCIKHEESQNYHPITYFICFTSKSSFKVLVNKQYGWDFALFLWIYIYLPRYYWK